jgi:hypothetical protein
MSSPKIFIVILQYNNSQDTVRCLESLKELSWHDFEAIIVENASDIQHLNNMRLFVESQKKTGEKRFRLISNKSNLGYAAGNNTGIKYALERGADYVLILNPDTVVEKRFLEKLIDTAQRSSKTGIVGPAVNEGNGMIYCGKVKWLKSELEHSALKPRSYILKSNFYIPGVAMLVNKKVFKKIGFFDERYFLYFEDVDFCVRAQKTGFKLAVAPGAVIHHRPSSSTSKLGAAFLLYYHYRNAHLFNVKNAPTWAKILLPFWSGWIIIKQTAKILLGVNVQVSKAILRGVLDFYRGRFGKISN